jgi:uncharacterized protein (DUF849 family)
MLLQACLNGDRDEPRVPKTPAELAGAAASCVAAGARSIHCHPRDVDGQESLAPADVAAAVHAIRTALPRTELSLTTGLWITNGDLDTRARAIAGWTERPDLVSLNLSEEGWIELARLLAERGIGIEAGVWTTGNVEALAESGLVEIWARTPRGGFGRGRRHPPVRRILVEPPSESGPDALALAAEIDAALDAAAIPTPRLHHGVGPATWELLDAAVPLGRDIRIGFEDTLTLPDGRPAPDNAALVAEAARRYGS